MSAESGKPALPVAALFVRSRIRVPLVHKGVRRRSLAELASNASPPLRKMHDVAVGIPDASRRTLSVPVSPDAVSRAPVDSAEFAQPRPKPPVLLHGQSSGRLPSPAQFGVPGGTPSIRQISPPCSTMYNSPARSWPNVVTFVMVAAPAGSSWVVRSTKFVSPPAGV